MDSLTLVPSRPKPPDDPCKVGDDLLQMMRRGGGGGRGDCDACGCVGCDGADHLAPKLLVDDNGGRPIMVLMNYEGQTARRLAKDHRVVIDTLKVQCSDAIVDLFVCGCSIMAATPEVLQPLTFSNLTSAGALLLLLLLHNPPHNPPSSRRLAFVTRLRT
jgi:hypothetical protein